MFQSIVLEIPKIKLPVYIGAFDNELLFQQFVNISISIKFGFNKAIFSDDVDDSICYFSLIQYLKNGVCDLKIRTIEAFSFRVMQIVKQYIQIIQKQSCLSGAKINNCKNDNSKNDSSENNHNENDGSKKVNHYIDRSATNNIKNNNITNKIIKNETVENNPAKECPAENLEICMQDVNNNSYLVNVIIEKIPLINELSGCVRFSLCEF